MTVDTNPQRKKTASWDGLLWLDHLSTLDRTEGAVSFDHITLFLRLMTEQDLLMLHDWLNRPHVVEWRDDGQHNVSAEKA